MIPLLFVLLRLYLRCLVQVFDTLLVAIGLRRRAWWNEPTRWAWQGRARQRVPEARVRR